MPTPVSAAPSASPSSIFGGVHCRSLGTALTEEQGGGLFLAVILQDNKRATLLGHESAGPPLALSESISRIASGRSTMQKVIRFRAGIIGHGLGCANEERSEWRLRARIFDRSCRICPLVYAQCCETTAWLSRLLLRHGLLIRESIGLDCGTSNINIQKSSTCV